MNALLLDPARLDRPDTTAMLEPFPFLIAHAQLPESARKDLAKDFPVYREAGFFPWNPDECGDSINRLIEDLTTPAVATAIGARLGIEHLGQYPTLVTLCRHLNKRHGTIHTDSRSKVATALLYLNDQWPDTSEGCLRFLSQIDDIDATLVPELKPLYGEFAVFKRCDNSFHGNSFHGHLPYGGERRVIQVAWLVDEEAKARKTQRGKISRLFKKIVGGLDKKFGAGRDRNASHPD